MGTCCSAAIELEERAAYVMLNTEPCQAPTGANRDVLRARQRPAQAGVLGASSIALRVGLEDLLGDLWDARRRGDMGRLALVLYCEVLRWARQAGEPALAQQASALMVDGPLASREEFLAQVDRLIGELEAAHERQV
jgi:hypothetical protein